MAMFHSYSKLPEGISKNHHLSKSRIIATQIVMAKSQYGGVLHGGTPKSLMYLFGDFL